MHILPPLMTHARFLDNRPPVPLRSLRFARFLSTGGDYCFGSCFANIGLPSVLVQFVVRYQHGHQPIQTAKIAKMPHIWRAFDREVRFCFVIRQNLARFRFCLVLNFEFANIGLTVRLGRRGGTDRSALHVCQRH